MIFVDTGAWFALFVPSDPDHKRLNSWLDANPDPMLTTDFIIDETLTLLASRGRAQLALQAGKAFFEEHPAALHFMTPAQIHRTWILFQQRVQAGWSFTDCTSKVVIDELGIKKAVALDEHFRQFGISVEP